MRTDSNLTHRQEAASLLLGALGAFLLALWLLPPVGRASLALGALLGGLVVVAIWLAEHERDTAPPPPIMTYYGPDFPWPEGTHDRLDGSLHVRQDTGGAMYRWDARYRTWEALTAARTSRLGKRVRR